MINPAGTKGPQLWVTLGDCLDDVHRQLADSDCFYGHGTDSAWDEAVALVLDSVELPPDSGAEVLSKPLAEFPGDPSELVRTRLITRIAQRVPLPYITGSAWFAGQRFLCDKRAIIPRSPLAEMIHNGFQPWLRAEPECILDLCCGGGCIGLAALRQFPDATAQLADIDPDALSLAQENIALHAMEDRAAILQSDVFSACTLGAYDLILCNPPYVDAGELASMPKEFTHEPQLALGSGADGLDLISRVLADAADYLTSDGLLVAEVGNSWVALEERFPRMPFMWQEFEHGGHGVFVMVREELLANRESLR